jgi:urease accessory protein
MVTAGAAIAILIVVSLLAGQAASIQALWARVALRVVGSWIAAIGIFMLGWSLRITS